MLKDLINKNSTIWKRVIPCLLILIILVGLFTPMVQVHAAATDPAAFKNAIDGGCAGLWDWSFDGCLLKLAYYFGFVIPSFALWLSAQFFNSIISFAVHDTVTSSAAFISIAWGIVRDLSNIFFILALLYIAIQTILGMGHETKKMIVHVIIMALLINFSMFFTKVVIDSSNVLALIFYNKIGRAHV